MFKKIFFIFLLATGLATFLYVRDYYKKNSAEPRLIDRIPTGDFLLRANILDVAKETSSMLFFNKVDYRDFFAYEFLLGQGKSYGLDFQRPLYVFGNENGDWGALIHVTDSSKIQQGIQRLKGLLPLKDTSFFDYPVISWGDEKAYISYGKTWLFIYKGERFKPNLFCVVHAKRDQIAPAWQSFLNEPKFKNEKLVIASNWKNMKRYGIEKAVFAHDSDSTSFTLKAYVKSSKDWVVRPKAGGKGLAIKPTTDKFLDIHVDAKGLLQSKEDPLYRLMAQMSKKVSFPLDQFLAAWEGDLSFRQGGSLTVTETFIETVFDDDFNPLEVESTREIQVPGFSLALSMNYRYDRLLNSLITKGILTQEGEKYRFLVSPLLNYEKQGNYHLFYSGQESPNLKYDTENNGLWNERGTKFEFHLDSVTKNEAYGTIKFPVQRILRRNKFF